jgi:hypothetical protein
MVEKTKKTKRGHKTTVFGLWVQTNGGKHFAYFKNAIKMQEVQNIAEAFYLLRKDLATKDLYLSDMKYKMVEDGFLIVGERGVYHGWCGYVLPNADRYRTTDTYFVGFNKTIQRIKTETVLIYHYPSYKNERVYIDAVIYNSPPELDSASNYVNPEFIGGRQALGNFAKDSLTYPVSALENLIYGRTTVSFILDTDGSIKDVGLIRGFNPHCDREVVRFVKSTAGKWNAGKLNGKNVPVEVVIIVSFRFEKKGRWED